MAATDRGGAGPAITNSRFPWERNMRCLSGRPPRPRQHWLRGPLACGGALALVMLFPSVTGAWSQLNNSYPNSPQSCTDPGGYCISWPKTANNMSVTLLYYLDPSLNLGYLDLTPYVGPEAGYWNNTPARNPILTKTGYYYSAVVFIEVGDIRTNCGMVVFACTWNDSSGHTIYNSRIYLNNQTVWNVTGYITPTNADARCIIGHELGHVQALGHSGIAGIMNSAYQYSHVIYKPLTNDIAGLQAIYGAYP
jgi:Matrixin